MQLSWEQLSGLPVETQSGQKLGVVDSVMVDTESHRIMQYQVKPSVTLLALFKKPFLIAASQVVSLTNEKMIVQNAVAAQEPVTNKKQTRLASAVAKSELQVDQPEL